MLAEISLILLLINVGKISIFLKKILHYYIQISYKLILACGKVQQSDVRFFLTSPDARMQEFNISGIKEMRLNNTKDIKIIAHGWLDGKDAFWYETTISNYVTKGNSYIVALDWSKHSVGSYTKAVDNLPEIGSLTAMMILELADAHNISLSNFHLIGHSLGAHLFGYAGNFRYI